MSAVEVCLIVFLCWMKGFFGGCYTRGCSISKLDDSSMSKLVCSFEKHHKIKLVFSKFEHSHQYVPKEKSFEKVH